MKKVILALFVIFLVGCTGTNVNLDLEPKDLPNPSIGPEDAQIVVTEYSDFQCPYCSAAAGIHPQLIPAFQQQVPGWEPAVPGLKEMAKDGRIRFEFKQFPLGSHANAFMAAQASEAAHAQGKFFEYHDLVFENQDQLTRRNLIKFAEELELDVELFTQELDSEVYAASVRKDLGEGQRAGITGTPAFMVNGELISGAQPLSVFQAKIAQLEAELEPADNSTEE